MEEVGEVRGMDGMGSTANKGSSRKEAEVKREVRSIRSENV